MKQEWLTNNLIPIVLTLLTWAVSFGILSTKVDLVIKNQDSLTAEFREWKKQYEGRLGNLEITSAVHEGFHNEVARVLNLK